MAAKTDKGCGTPQDATRKAIHQRLVQLFAPIICFEAEEQYFPVDLESAAKHSALWQANLKVDPPTSQKVRDAGQINLQQDLLAASKDHYTTVAGTQLVQKQVEGKPPFNMPVPRIKQVCDAYKDGTVPAKLTLYGTVCSAHDVCNSDLIAQCGPCRDAEVGHAMSEGLIVSYYMYFPAYDAPDFKREGDWSGISLLLRATPTTLEQLGSSARLEQFLPVLACYYSKTTEDAPPLGSFVAGTRGFRRWQQVKRTREPSVGADTHPVVYVSRGRHNCYYEPITGTTKLSPPWWGEFTPDGIENGSYTVGPGATIEGYSDTPWWVYVLFPPLAPLEACASGCQQPVSFDPSGLPSGYPEREDVAKDDGFSALPGGQASGYPSQSAGQVPAGSKQLNLELKYVDLDDATTAALWGYPGAWGGATFFVYESTWDPNNPSGWGYYQGARRPALAAWFAWNLFLNSQFGPGGTAAGGNP